MEKCWSGDCGAQGRDRGWGGRFEAVMNEMLIVDGFFPPSSFGGQAGPPLHTYINT